MSTDLSSDLLVLDCASFIAGPAAATILSDFGARVIKIEPPGLGDAYRNLIRLRGEPGTTDYFWTLDSRNKESLALNLKLEPDRAVLRRLIAKADVFITNHPFPVRETLGLTAQEVRALNPRLIYASLSPYGEAGPERDRTAYDTTAWWARSGLMDMVRATGNTERALSVPGMGDHPTAVALYGAIVTALYRRQKTGEGGEVSTSLLANGMWSNACQIQAALCDIELIGRGERGERDALIETYETADDRFFILAIANPDRQWPRLARAVGRPDWLDDPLFSTPAARFENCALLGTLLQDIFSTQPWVHWDTVLSEAGVTFGIVGRTSDHLSDPQVQANDLLPQFEDGSGLRTVDSPFQIAGEIKRQPKMAPDVGQHNLDILVEFGCTAEEIASVTQGSR